MNFNILKLDSQTKARCGFLETDHGIIETPIFMPVGTVATVKGVHQHELENEVKAQIILANTYHLFLRPKTEILAQAKGLHKFMNWQKPILTDSGGYQVYSLAGMRKLKPEGVYFQSHIDGSKHFFSPENIVDVQRIIGSDIMMALDECTPFPSEYSYAKKSMELTHSWLKRGIKHFRETQPLYEHQQTYFPIVQGSTFRDLRTESAEFISSMNAEGNAIGGLSVGEPVEMMYEIIEVVNNILPKDKPRYLMGVGTPANILEGISRGIDMFDCVMPTRNGRNGMLFTWNGIINIKNEKWKNDFSPIDVEGKTLADTQYSKAYLRHLMVANERLASQIASIHNLAFYLQLVQEARNKIISGEFYSWKEKMVKQLTTRL